MLFYNAATDQGKITCVYPISGQYGLMPRLLYYFLLLFAVLARRQVWLMAGALGSALTFSGSSALHAVALAATRSRPLLDMDSFAIWAIVSSGSLSGRLFFDWSETLRKSPARPVFRIWGFLMIVGVICSAESIFADYADETICLSWGGVLLSSPLGLGVTQYQFNCTYECFGTRKLFRQPGEIQAVLKQTSVGRHSQIFLISLILTFVFGCLFGIIGLAVIAKHEIRHRSAPSHTITTETKLVASRYRYVAPFVWVIIVVLNEVLLLGGPGVPAVEQPFAVGQWSPWVATTLALLASMVIELRNRYSTLRRGLFWDFRSSSDPARAPIALAESGTQSSG